MFFAVVVLIMLQVGCFLLFLFYLSVLLGNAGGYKIALKYKMARCLVYIFWFIALAGVDGQKNCLFADGKFV